MLRSNEDESNNVCNRLVQDLDVFQKSINDKAFLLNLHVFAYYRSMLAAIDGNETDFTRDQLLNCHKRTKESVVNKVKTKDFDLSLCR